MDVNKRFCEAAKKGDIEEIDKALAEGADINAIVDGYSALTTAIFFHHFEVVKHLCEKGIDVNVRPRGGYTPLDFAEMYGFDDIAEYLRSRRADTCWGLDD